MSLFTFSSAFKLVLSWIVPASIIFVFLVRRKKYRMPPGPLGFPLFGSLFSLKPPVYKSMNALAKIYGPIMTVRLGSLPNVIISNSKLAKEVLKTHDNILASRPPTVFSGIMVSSGVDMVWSPLGHQWQENRKLVNTELLSANSLKRFKQSRDVNIAKLIQDLTIAAQNSTPVVMRYYLWNVVVNNMSRMVMGSNYSGNKIEAQEIKQVVSDTLRIGNLFNLGDFIPFLRMLDLNWVYKETLRLHPPTAMMLPHYSTQDCNIDGFDIPANTAVHVNVYAINRDPANWENPEEFMPERFEKEDVDMRGYDFRLLPFGAGRRICPGARMAILSSTLILAKLLQKFELVIPDGKKPADVDMVEEFGIVQCMRTPISALVKPRISAL